MNRINTIVFDYDGTLHDTSGIYITAFKKCYRKLVKDGYASERDFADSEITRFLGCTATEMWNTFMPELPENVKTQSMGIIRDEMAKLINAGKSRLFDGVFSTLSELKKEGRNLVVLSNCAVRYMENHRNHFMLDELFDEYFCAEAYDFAPKHEIFKNIKSKYSGEYCMVGDRYHDFEAGKQNNALTIGCGFGFGTDDELAKADIVIPDMSDLLNVIHSYEKAHYNRAERI